MWDGSLPVLRARYEFDLASVCNCPPPVVDRMRLIVFARFITGLDQMRAQQQGGSRG